MQRRVRHCSGGLGEVPPCLPWPMDIMGRLFRPPDGGCPFIERQPVAPRAEGSPALVLMSTEVGDLFLLKHHTGCEWRGEFAMGMPEAAC